MTARPSHPLVRSFLHDVRWSPTTVKSAVEKLNTWDAWCRRHGIVVLEATRADCEAYLAERSAAGSAPATVHVHWRMLRAFYRWAYDEGEMEYNPTSRIKGPRVSETPVRVLEADEYAKLMATCDKRTTLGRRDAAMLSLLWWSGIRRSELVGVDLDALDLDGAALTIGSRRIGTKTGRVRRVPLAAETVRLLERYLRQRGDEPGPLFVSQRTAGDGRLAPNTVQLMLRRRATQAGLGRSVGAHEFRRAMAVRYKRAGGSDPGLMAVAGWSSIRMVDRYTRMQRDDLAAEEFHRLIDTSAAPARRRARRVG